MSEEIDRFEVLDIAITAAEAATQTVAALWERMTPAEQDRWLPDAATVWPRRDIYLKTLLPAADRIVADRRAADDF